MTDVERNKKAQQHGETGEAAAVVWLQNRTPDVQVKIINQLLDLLVSETYIEVKTCGALIATEPGRPPRAGRFTLEPAQHLSLVKVGGYYLFVVLHKVIPPTLFLVYAKDLYYHRQVSWPVAYKVRTSFAQSTIGEKKGEKS